MTTLFDAAKQQLNITTTDDDELISRLLDTAQEWLEAQIGYKLADKYPPTGSPAVSTVPTPLDHARLLLVSHWYANREATLVGVSATPLPFGVADIVNDWRDWSWGEADA
jgi:hypothetical protein